MVSENGWNQAIQIVVQFDESNFEVRRKKHSIPQYSGRAVFSLLLPDNFFYSSGNVKIKNAKGAVQVSERSGSVCLEEVEATILSVETRSGDISVRDSGGVVELKTSSGNVALKKMRAKALSVEAASGNVDADLCQPVTGSVNVTAVTGNVHMGIVENCDCRVNLNTLRGTVASSVPLLDETIVEGRVTGQLGSGLGQLDVSVVTGNVSFEIRDSSAD